MLDFSQAFSPKADGYAQYRWDYAAEAIDQVCARAGLRPGATVADVGAGTGQVSAHFLKRGLRVAAVEPSAEMRRLAAEWLGKDPNFRVLDGYGHATGLAAGSMDLVAAGRALHWFEHAPTRAEFVRILRPGGWLAVLQTPTTDPYLAQAMGRLRLPEAGWKMEQSKHHLTPAVLSFYFGTDNFETITVPHVIAETWAQFFGRVSSLSPAPNPDEALYEEFVRVARAIFDQGALDGRLRVQYATMVSIHPLRP